MTFQFFALSLAVSTLGTVAGIAIAVGVLMYLDRE